MKLEHLIESIRELPEHRIQQVQDYVNFLKAKYEAKQGKLQEWEINSLSSSKEERDKRN